MYTLPRLGPDTPLSPTRPPGSKSVANRVLLLAAMAPGTSRIHNIPECEDTDAMAGALRALGVIIEGPEVRPGPRVDGARLHVGASGTTLRFLVPWLATTAREPVEFEGAVRLFERPMAGLIDALEGIGVRWEPRRGGGRLIPADPAPRSMDTWIDASASSQFVTGLALAMAAMPGGGRLRFADVPSRSYLELTARWIRAFGVEVVEGRAQSSLVGPETEAWLIHGSTLRPTEVTIPGDWSGAAALLAAGAVGSRTATVGPLDLADPQGDRAILGILEAAGADVQVDGDTVRVTGPLRRGLDADLELCPDLGPVLVGLATSAPGPSVFRGLRTLRLKECDRIDASAELVRWCGGRAEVEGDEVLRVFPGVPSGERPPFNPRADHRMAFAAAVAGLRHGGTVLDPGCVAKTFPRFWEVWGEMVGERPA